MINNIIDHDSNTSAIEELKFLQPEEVRFIAETFGTPVYVYHEASIKNNSEYMKSLPNAYGLTVRYSVKALGNKSILRLINSIGLEFDTSSEWEALRVINAGISPSKILLTSQEFGSQVADLIQQGIQFDAGSLHQLECYGKLFPGREVSIRINPGFGSGLVNRLTSGGPNSSFGIWHEEKENIKKCLDRYHLRLARLHTHIGSGHHPKTLLDCLDKMLDFSVYFGHVPIINLGGGYRIKAFKSDELINHAKIFEHVKDKIIKYFLKYQKQIHIEVEPGTFIMGNTGSIITRVIDRVTTGANGNAFIKINAGLTEIMRPSYYGAPHPLVIVPATIAKNQPRIIDDFCVVGHCCIAGDVLTTKLADVEYLSPQKLLAPDIGDYLVIERAGGYCSSMAVKNFNSYPEAAEVLKMQDGKFKLIRQRQSLDQLTQNEVLDALPISLTQ